MKISRIKEETLRAAGYKSTPPHCEDNNTLQEYVRAGKLIRFPRFHIKLDKDGWDLHYDVTPMHGREIAGSIINSGRTIDKELDRIRIIGTRHRLGQVHRHLIDLIKKYEWRYGKKEEI